MPKNVQRASDQPSQVSSSTSLSLSSLELSDTKVYEHLKYGAGRSGAREQGTAVDKQVV